MSASGSIPATRRLVSIAVSRGTGGAEEELSYGSGLLIGGQQVLTAAHVVWDATAISIYRVSDGAEWIADVHSMLVGDVQNFDMAILDVDAAESLGDVPIAAVNRDISDGDQVIDKCWAVGFPVFQQYRRPGAQGPTRESAQVGGTISPLSGLRANVLSLEVTSSPRDGANAQAESEWSGMSGAGVFAGDLLIGIVTEHHPDRGASNITVTPFDQLLDDDGAPTHVSQWRRRLGLGDLSAIPRLPAPEPPPEHTPPPVDSDNPPQTPPNSPSEPELEKIMPGNWVLDVQNMMGTQTVRLQLGANQNHGGPFGAMGVFGMPLNWQAQGTWQVLPEHRLVLTGVQASPMSFPPQIPLQENYTFTSVEQNMLRGANTLGAPVTWRRE